MNRAEFTSYALAMCRYNAWMNERLYEASGQLLDEERKRDLGAFFGSVHGTLNHVLLADRIWMDRFAGPGWTGSPFVIDSLRDELYADFHELKLARQREDARIAEWMSGLSAADFDSELKYVSSVNPQPRSYPLWFAIVHFFNHQTHHRGQITTLLC